MKILVRITKIHKGGMKVVWLDSLTNHEINVLFSTQQYWVNHNLGYNLLIEVL